MKERKNDSKQALPFSSRPPLSLPATEPPSITSPGVDPPVPNRAWTQMRLGTDIDALSEEEKRDLYLGRDPAF